MVARVRSGRRTLRPRSRRPSKAWGEVTSWTRWRSMPSTSGAPSVPGATRCSSQILSTIVRGRAESGFGSLIGRSTLADSSRPRSGRSGWQNRSSHVESLRADRSHPRDRASHPPPAGRRGLRSMGCVRSRRGGGPIHRWRADARHGLASYVRRGRGVDDQRLQHVLGHREGERPLGRPARPMDAGRMAGYRGRLGAGQGRGERAMPSRARPRRSTGRSTSSAGTRSSTPSIR